MILWRVAALVAVTCVPRAVAGSLEELQDTSSMLIMRTDIDVADDASVEPSTKLRASALADSEAADDTSKERFNSTLGAASTASFAQVAKTAESNETWTESFAEVLNKVVHFHAASEDLRFRELPTDRNFTVSGLKENAQQVLLFTILEGLGGVLFVAAVMGCFCFCTVRQAQADARATAHTADIRKARETGRFTARHTMRSTTRSSAENAGRGTTFSKRSSKEYCDDDDDEDEEWEDDTETQDTEDENGREVPNNDAKSQVRFGGTESKFIEE